MANGTGSGRKYLYSMAQKVQCVMDISSTLHRRTDHGVCQVAGLVNRTAIAL